jgi:hypothetical protein
MPVLDYGHLLAPGGLYRAQIAVRTVMGLCCTNRVMGFMS